MYHIDWGGGGVYSLEIPKIASKCILDAVTSKASENDIRGQCLLFVNIFKLYVYPCVCFLARGI